MVDLQTPSLRATARRLMPASVRPTIRPRVRGLGSQAMSDMMQYSLRNDNLNIG